MMSEIYVKIILIIHLTLGPAAGDICLVLETSLVSGVSGVNTGNHCGLSSPPQTRIREMRVNKVSLFRALHGHLYFEV